jgi:hypothetical protein
MGGVRFLRADPSIDCNASGRTAWLVFVAVAVIVYPLGVPAAFFVLLWRRRRQLNPTRHPHETDQQFVKRRNADPSIRHIAFLVGSYRPGAWYMEW